LASLRPLIHKEEKMANKRFWLGMLVLTLVFGMTVLGCDNDDDGGSGNGNDNFSIVVQPTNGSLTITGLSAYNGKYVIASGSGYTEGHENYVSLIGAQNMSSNVTYTGGLVSSGQVTLKVWKMINSNTIGNYNGNHEAFFSILVVNKSNITMDDMNAFENYLRFDYAKPTWFVEEEHIYVEAFSGGIGTGSIITH
jgi:hypothetical protein